MKFLQLNITSFNTSCDDLWCHQLENQYDGIFLQETNHRNNTLLGNFKTWKVNMHTIYENKTLGYGVGSLFPSHTKNVFRQDLITKDLEMVWSEIEINEKKVLIGNIYIPPNNIEQLHALDKFLENHKDENLIILGDFNARNTLWDIHCNKNNKMGTVLEDLIQRHGLYLATNVDHSYQQTVQSQYTGKSTIDLTLSRGISNISVNTIDITNIKTRHKGIEITIDTQNTRNNSLPHFKTKDANWGKWAEFLDNNLLTFLNSFPHEISKTIIDEKAELFVDIIFNSASQFFGMTELSKKESKGWWNKDIKIARTNLKNAKKQYKMKQSPTNLKILQEHKLALETLIKNSKQQSYQRNSDFLNNSKDSTQFWHRYNKIIGSKKDNVIEPLLHSPSNTYIFHDEEISNILFNYHINKDKSNNKYDEPFKNNINNELNNILHKNTVDESYVFFDETHVKTAIQKLFTWS